MEHPETWLNPKILKPKTTKPQAWTFLPDRTIQKPQNPTHGRCFVHLRGRLHRFLQRFLHSEYLAPRRRQCGLPLYWFVQLHILGVRRRPAKTPRCRLYWSLRHTAREMPKTPVRPWFSCMRGGGGEFGCDFALLNSAYKMCRLYCCRMADPGVPRPGSKTPFRLPRPPACAESIGHAGVFGTCPKNSNPRDVTTLKPQNSPNLILGP